GEHVLEVTVNGGLQRFVALDGFQVVVIDIYERRRGQHDRQFQREQEPEPVIAPPRLFHPVAHPVLLDPLRLHFSLPETRRQMNEAYTVASRDVSRGGKKMSRKRKRRL